LLAADCSHHIRFNQRKIKSKQSKGLRRWFQVDSLPKVARQQRSFPIKSAPSRSKADFVLAVAERCPCFAELDLGFWRERWSSEHVKSVGTVGKLVCWTGTCQLAGLLEVANVLATVLWEITIIEPI
jgi:hypothetical protein